MRILAWNCRGLGSPSTVPQLKESLRLYKLEIVFLCETKRKSAYVSTVYKELEWANRWKEVDPLGKSGGLLVGWGRDVTIHTIQLSDFCVEVETIQLSDLVTFEGLETNGRMWAIFVYASIKGGIKSEQWQKLISRKQRWGENWILGRHFNAIRDPGEKKKGEA